MKKIITTLATLPLAVQYFWSILPVGLLISGFIPTRANPIVLAVVLIVVIATIFYNIEIKKKWTWRDIGHRADMWSAKSMLAYACITIIFCAGFYLVYPLMHDVKYVTLDAPKVIFSLVISTGQVILFQGFLMKLGDELFDGNKNLNIGVNTTIYVFMHSFFSLDIGEYILIAIGGLGFSGIYNRYPNIYLVALFHFATNILAIKMNMFHTF